MNGLEGTGCPGMPPGAANSIWTHKAIVRHELSMLTCKEGTKPLVISHDSSCSDALHAVSRGPARLPWETAGACGRLPKVAIQGSVPAIDDVNPSSSLEPEPAKRNQALSHLLMLLLLAGCQGRHLCCRLQRGHFGCRRQGGHLGLGCRAAATLRAPDASPSSCEVTGGGKLQALKASSDKHNMRPHSFQLSALQCTPRTSGEHLATGQQGRKGVAPLRLQSMRMHAVLSRALRLHGLIGRRMGPCAVTTTSEPRTTLSAGKHAAGL